METEYLLIWKDYTQGNPVTHHEVFQDWNTLREFVAFITQEKLVGGLYLMKWDGVKLVSLGRIIYREVEECHQ